MPGRARKRTLLMVLLLLTGGAIINVAVAWGCVLWIEGPSGKETLENSWPETAPTTWEEDARTYIRFNWASTKKTSYGGLRTGEAAMAVMYVHESGAPFRTLKRIIRQVNYAGESLGRPDQAKPQNWSEGIVWPERLDWMNRHIERVVPATPIWPGFAINTVFYAAILWMLWLAPGFVRRRVRSMRGRCRVCGYSLHNRAPDSTRCPECGAEI